MAWSSEEEKFKILDDVAEILAACGDEPIIGEALALTIAQKVFPVKYGYEIKRRERFLNKCMGQQEE
jgi:hypothetical protein